jgi:hypothetical protein
MRLVLIRNRKRWTSVHLFFALKIVEAEAVIAPERFSHSARFGVEVQHKREWVPLVGLFKL